MFHIIEREMRWRKEHGKEEGFGALHSSKPIVAVGAEEPLEDQRMLADYFRGFSIILSLYHRMNVQLMRILIRWHGWSWRHPRECKLHAAYSFHLIMY